MNLLYLLTVISASLIGAQAQRLPVRYTQLSTTLDSLALVDQRPMVEMVERGQLSDSVAQRLEQEEERNFHRHQPVLERIVHRYGFPGFQEVGEVSSHNFWLLVQHADAYPTFQQQVLRLMLPQVKRHNASAKDYAYLADRIAVHTGQLQVYGTQLLYKQQAAGGATPAPIRLPQQVDRRRAAMGLEPLQTYLHHVNKLRQHAP